MDRERLIEILRQYWIPLVLLGIGCVVLGYGMFSVYSSGQASKAAVQAAQDFPSISPISHKQQITVDVEGAILKPGVYQLDTGSRVQDALIASGGLSEDADRSVIAQTINLAQPLTDGVKIYFPRTGETAPASGSSGALGVAGASTTVVNVNSATESDLEALPGIGPVTAGKIIAGRPYESVDDLLQKKVLGASTFAKVKDQLSVY